MRIKLAVLTVLLLIAHGSAFGGYSSVVKITAVESQKDAVSIYVNDGSIPGNPGQCVNGSGPQIFIANDTNLERVYAAALTALATKADVQLLISGSSICLYDHRIVSGIRVKN